MKFILLLVMFLVCVARAEIKLPTVSINEQTLGGDILLINMKDYLVIQGTQSKALESELGPNLKKHFTRDIVMAESVDFLKTKYGLENRPVTNEIIKIYAEIILINKKRDLLN